MRPGLFKKGQGRTTHKDHNCFMELKEPNAETEAAI